MEEIKYLSIAEFAKAAGVSKQAIYKQIGNESSQLAPYILKRGKRQYINIEALRGLYGVEYQNSTFSTQDSTFSTQEGDEKSTDSTTEVEEVDQKSTPIQPVSTQEIQPISTDYIEFLKAEIAALKADKAATEERLNATIQEKDELIKDQSAQLAALAQQVADIASKALITTSQQQYLTAAEKIDKQDQQPEEPEPKKKSFWERLFGK